MRPLSAAFIVHRPSCPKCLEFGQKAGTEMCDLGRRLHRTGFDLSQGMYFIKHEVKNPKPDRRSKSWYEATSFPAEMRFYVQEDLGLKGLFSIGRLGKYGAIRSRTPLFEALAAELQPCAPYTRETLEIECVNGRRVLDWLVRDGALTIEAILATNKRGDPEEV